MTLHPSSRMASRSWVANKTARSPRRSFRSIAAFFMVSGSMPVKGSSSSRVSPGPEGAEQGRTSLLPAGKLPGRQGKRLLIISKSLKIRHDLRFVLCFSLREHQFHVLHGGQLRAEPILLKDSTDPAHALHRAGIRYFQPHQDAEQGGLAPAAGCPENGRLRKGKIQILKERFFSKTFC